MATRDFDAIIIGAGIIGAALALGLARKGWRTLNVDRLPAAGYGSTSGSCAIIRPYYSTVDGSALAYESHFYWKAWADFVGVADERGLARYVDCGCLVMKTEGNRHLAHIAAIMDEIGCPYEDLSPDDVRARLPIVTLDSFAPPKRPEDPDFGRPNGRTLAGALFFPTGGYVTDPQLASHNLQRAAEAKGAVFRFRTAVTDIVKEGGRAAGVVLESGEMIRAPVVVNVAGPHSFKINRMAGVEAGMKIRTRALRHEVCHVPAPGGFDFEHRGCVYSDNDIAVYMRPEHGNHILIGSED
ncbi:MAG: FAD-binding oxidoreductase, partial [Alphaproteobacteria bacterium]